MKAVIPSVPQHVLDERKLTGADRWDEMWEGVLHMGPTASPEHQSLEGAIEFWLRARWAQRRRARIYHQVNLATPGGWPKNYRIPDICIFLPQTRAVLIGDRFEGPPEVVVEIRSPDDESLEKLGFYAALGVPEVWIIDRDTKVPEIHVLTGGVYEVKAADGQGWLKSDVTGIELRAGPPGKLSMRVAGDDSTLESLPPE
jgi:Uma2 family endonuclease